MSVSVCQPPSVSWSLSDGLGAPGAERATDPSQARQDPRATHIISYLRGTEVLGMPPPPLSAAAPGAGSGAATKTICGYSWAKAGPARPSFWGGHREVSDLSLRAGTLCESVR